MRPLCVVLLAAGEGRRLAPLTDIVPKALCPDGNIALLDRALGAARDLGLVGPADVAVNAWHHAAAIVAHVGTPAHLSAATADADGPVGSRTGAAVHADGPAAHVNVETGPRP